MPYAYILRADDGRLYTGSAWDLSHRLDPSDRRPSLCSPFRRRPLQLVWVEWHEHIDEAFSRERQIHGWRRERKERLISDGSGSNDGGP